MKSEFELKKEQQRGLRAKQLIDDELIKNAFSDIRTNIYRKISESSFKQKDEREDCYRMLRAIEAFEGQFKKHINTGKLAEDRLSQLMRKIKRL